MGVSIYWDSSKGVGSGQGDLGRKSQEDIKSFSIHTRILDLSHKKFNIQDAEFSETRK
jgi:hypothetical protein